MNSTSLLRLFQGAFLAILAYLTIFGILGSLLIQTISQSFDQTVSANQAHQKVTRVRNVMLLVESAQRGYLYTGQRNYLISISDYGAEAETLLSELGQANLSETQKRRLGELRPRVTAKLQEMSETIQLKEAGKAEQARARVLDNEGKELMDQINRAIDAMQEEFLSTIVAARSQSSRLVGWLQGFIALGLLGFAVFTIVTYRKIAARFTPLHTLVERAGQISQGDLTGKPLAISVLDEIGIVTEAYNAMLDGLRKIFARTTEAETKIREISSRLARSSAEQASSSVQQATAVQETAVTLEELSQSATQIAERASEVGSESRATSAQGRQGLQAVQESIRLSEKSRQGVEEVASTIVALSQKAQDLEAIVASVNELAERSNILAINASIQAAAAGAEGVTFAVLASEMRMLANRSKEATVEVKGALAEIRNGIHKTVMLAEEAVKRSQSGDKNSRLTEETIRTLVESFKKGDDAFQQIVAATRQQSHAFKQVEEALVSIQETATAAENGSRELERDSHELTALSKELHTAMARYESGSSGPA